MDIGMEPMDGLECTRRLRIWERARTDVFTPLSIIAATANAHAESKEICMEAGMTDYIHKPISLDELVRVLRKAHANLVSATQPLNT
jgi:CheY-like chemotaxis protein